MAITQTLNAKYPDWTQEDWDRFRWINSWNRRRWNLARLLPCIRFRPIVAVRVACLTNGNPVGAGQYSHRLVSIGHLVSMHHRRHQLD
jgi:hypothetical protein